MKHPKTILSVSVLVLSIVVFTRCQNNDADKKMPATGSNTITPVPLPVVVPGFNFPEDSNTIYSWLKPYDSASVYKHAWGIWAGLTAQSGQVYENDSLLVYQTWLGIGDIQSIISGDTTNGLSEHRKSARVPLSFPNQIKHAIENRKEAALQGTIDTSAGQDFGVNFWVSVSYDPSAADHVIKNGLLKQSVLNSFQKPNGIGSIPPFPDSAITVKPVYFVGHVTDSLIRIAVWPGPPKPANAFGPTAWNNYVYVDVKNQQPANKQLTPYNGTNPPNNQQMNAATCNLNNFIYYTLDSAAARYFNKQQSPVQNDTARAGDVAILVAMHVTSKEISNWTWQSFYWAPDPSNPLAPSSTLAASLKPSQLSSAASHYALTTAYVMVLPNQPITGGSNLGATSMFGYNPYLEAPFSPSTFNFFNRLNPLLRYGVQTNCMSCHALATQQGGKYSSDQYISMDDKYFTNKVQLDFAWSIQAAIINDVSKPPAAAKK